MEEPLPLTTFHTESEDQPQSKTVAAAPTKGEIRNGGPCVPGRTEDGDAEEAACSRSVSSASVQPAAEIREETIKVIWNLLAWKCRLPLELTALLKLILKLRTGLRTCSIAI